MTYINSNPIKYILLIWYLLERSSSVSVFFHVEKGGSEHPRLIPGADHKQFNPKVDQ